MAALLLLLFVGAASTHLVRTQAEGAVLLDELEWEVEEISDHDDEGHVAEDAAHGDLIRHAARPDAGVQPRGRTERFSIEPRSPPV